jgi:hypothetical protein
MQAVVQNEVERQWQGIAKTEDGKQAVRTLGKRLRRVVNWWQDECHEFPPELMPNALLLNKLTALAVRCEEIAKAKSGKVEKDAPAKYDAAVHAYRLLKWFGVKKKIPAHDKESDFCRLAALLMNDSRADLTWQCKKYKKEVLARARKKNVLAPSKKVS